MKSYPDMSLDISMLNPLGDYLSIRCLMHLYVGRSNSLYHKTMKESVCKHTLNMIISMQNARGGRKVFFRDLELNRFIITFSVTYSSKTF